MSSPDGWYRDFFRGSYAELVRRIPWPTAEEAAYLTDVLALKPGAEVLDVPCGDGRLSFALAEKGVSVTGVDLSAELIAAASQTAAGRSLPVRFEQRDMRELPADGRLDAAFCFGNSFAYLGRDGDAAFLAAVRRALKPGGRFALMTGLSAEGVFANKLEKRWFPLGDMLFLVDTEYDPATAAFTSHYTIVRDGRTESRSAHYTIYTFRELAGLLRAAGFAVAHAHGSLAKDPFRIGSPGLWLVAVAE
jgi:SAM-dependent methyltransferase